MKSIVVGTVLAALLVPSNAHAESRAEVAFLGGWGTQSFDTSEGNKFGPGIGLRTGATFRRLWLGASATYQVGELTDSAMLDTNGNPVHGPYSLSVFAGGGEIGINLHFDRFVIRPYAWVGTLVYVQSALANGTPEVSLGDPIIRFAVAPSLHADYELPRSGIFFGLDVRVNLLVPGSSPRDAVVWADGTYTPTGWVQTEQFTAELSVFATVGRRF